MLSSGAQQLWTVESCDVPGGPITDLEKTNGTDYPVSRRLQVDESPMSVKFLKLARL